MEINPPYLDRNLPISPARLPTCGEEKVRMVNILSLKSCEANFSRWIGTSWDLVWGKILQETMVFWHQIVAWENLRETSKMTSNIEVSVDVPIQFWHLDAFLRSKIQAKIHRGINQQMFWGFDDWKHEDIPKQVMGYKQRHAWKCTYVYRIHTVECIYIYMFFYACVHAWMYVCMHACIYNYIIIYIYTPIII